MAKGLGKIKQDTWDTILVGRTNFLWNRLWWDWASSPSGGLSEWWVSAGLTARSPLV